MLRRLFTISRISISAIWKSINILLMAFLIFAAYCGYINPDKLAYPQLINLIFPLCVAGAICMTIINLFFNRYLTLAWILAITACGGPILTFSPLNFTAQNEIGKNTGKYFSLLTYNVFDFQNPQQINPKDNNNNQTASYIISDSADIVCIQECGTFIQSPTRSEKKQSDSIKSLYPFMSGTGKHVTKMVLSKYSVKNIPVSHPKWGSGSYQACWIELPALDKPLLLINCHLQSFRLTPGEKSVYREMAANEHATRSNLKEVKSQIKDKLIPALRLHAAQARSIAAFIDSINAENVIVCGDFNDVCGSYAYRYLRNRCNLADAYSQTAFGPTATYNDSKLYFHIDQVLYRGSFKAKSIRRGNVPSSDHYPLTTLFEINK